MTFEALEQKNKENKMANNVIVNNIDHKDLKIIADRGAEYGDNIWYGFTFPMEFRSVQGHYPIFFRKDPDTGRFLSMALFGFKSNENLFLNGNTWDASYVPVSIQRQPFMISTKTVNDGGVEKEERMLTVDLEHPRVSKEKGEPLFLELGGNTPYLERMAGMMESIHHGMTDSANFTAFLAEHDLLEPFTLDIQLNDGSKHQMIGFYAINEDKLNALPDETIVKLQKSGYLQAIYMAIASQSNIPALIARKNKLMGL